MGQWAIYDHVDEGSNNTIQSWLDGLDEPARSKVDAKIVMLRQYGGDLPHDILSDTDDPSIKKLRIRGRINWRVLLCRGPVDVKNEFTLLDAVYEKDNKMPKGSVERAVRLRQAVAQSPSTRRTPHEFEDHEVEE